MIEINLHLLIQVLVLQVVFGPGGLKVPKIALSIGQVILSK